MTRPTQSPQSWARTARWYTTWPLTLPPDRLLRLRSLTCKAAENTRRSGSSTVVKNVAKVPTGGNWRLPRYAAIADLLGRREQGADGAACEHAPELVHDMPNTNANAVSSKAPDAGGPGWKRWNWARMDPRQCRAWQPRAARAPVRPRRAARSPARRGPTATRASASSRSGLRGPVDRATQRRDPPGLSTSQRVSDDLLQWASGLAALENSFTRARTGRIGRNAPTGLHRAIRGAEGAGVGGADAPDASHVSRCACRRTMRRIVSDRTDPSHQGAAPKLRSVFILGGAVGSPAWPTAARRSSPRSVPRPSRRRCSIGCWRPASTASASTARTGHMRSCAHGPTRRGPRPSVPGARWVCCSICRDRSCGWQRRRRTARSRSASRSRSSAPSGRRIPTTSWSTSPASSFWRPSARRS